LVGVSTSAIFILHILTSREIEACDKHTYEYIRTHRHEVIDRPASPSKFNATKHGTQSEDEDSAAESDFGDRFKLMLRSAVTKDITLTVKPTTKCAAIVKAFIKAAKLSTNATPKKGGGPRLMVDGERMDPDAEIGSADVEDGDMVEVVGL
jgi:Ubiquitin-2 like Rad60 SUMO-like